MCPCYSTSLLPPSSLCIHLLSSFGGFCFWRCVVVPWFVYLNFLFCYSLGFGFLDGGVCFVGLHVCSAGPSEQLTSNPHDRPCASSSLQCGSNTNISPSLLLFFLLHTHSPLRLFSGLCLYCAYFWLTPTQRRHNTTCKPPHLPHTTQCASLFNRQACFCILFAAFTKLAFS